MKELLYTDNIGFPMDDWKHRSIKKVFAGMNCIMAITDSGETLQKTLSAEYAARTQYWTRAEQIAVSRLVPGLAIGLISDGTCMISKRPLRIRCDGSNSTFERINDKVKCWKNVVQVAASDAFFALDRSGRVHYVAFDPYSEEEYAEINTWTDVRYLVTGPQNSVLGITSEGRVLCAGSSLVNGPHRDMRKEFSELRDVTDIAATGSECEDFIIAFRDGTVRSWKGDVLPVTTSSVPASRDHKILDGHFWYTVFIHGADKRIYKYHYGNTSLLFPEDVIVTDFSLGDINYSEPFLIAVSEQS